MLRSCNLWLQRFAEIKALALVQDMSQDHKELTIIPEDINILLVGESGAGKSTFAHAFANYVKYDQFSVAEKSKVSYLHPTFLNNHHAADDDGREIGDITPVPSENACSYVFPLLKYGRRIHLIDTPGFTDVAKDINNFESILTYVSQVERLHAVCFVLKPSSSVEILVLQYRIKFLLSRLEKSASKNVIFLFTHSRNPCYSRQYADVMLKGIYEQIENSPSQADVKCSRKNVFCLDNEAFCFLISSPKATIGQCNKKMHAGIWDCSAAECWRMVEYILGKADGSEEIKPHEVKGTVLLHNARKVVSQAAQFFVDIADIIEHLERDSILTDDILLNQYLEPTDSNQACGDTDDEDRWGYGYYGYDSDDYCKSTTSLGKARKLVANIEQKRSYYENRKQSVESGLQNLTAFVKLNAILPCNDSYEAYIKYLISQKIQQTAEKDTDTRAVINYHGLIKRYAEEMRIINRNVDVSPRITTTHILESIQQLNKLQKIKQKFERLRRRVITAPAKQLLC